jgi:high-affinity iron transporter
MEVGAISSGLVTGLREGVEAALIVSIVLAYLARTDNLRFAGRIWLGVAAAAATSAALGVLLFVTVGELPEPYEQIFEGATLLVAAGIVTWMLFWMRRAAASVKGELHVALGRALGEGSAWGLTALAFTAILREGIETSVFLVAQATAANSAEAGGGAPGGWGVLVGAIAGLAIATFLGVGFYHGSRRINLARFFRWTGIALILIAAGLVGRGVHEFAEIGLIAQWTQPAFDLSRVLPDDAGLGAFLRALVGYAAAPEVVTLVLQVGYLLTVLVLYLRPTAPRIAATPSPVSPAQPRP